MSVIDLPPGADPTEQLAEEGNALGQAVLDAAEERNECTICEPPKVYNGRHARDECRKHFRRVHGIELPKKTPGRQGTGPKAAGRERPPRVPASATRGTGLEARFAASLATVGLGIHMWCPVCGETFVDGTPDLAQAWCAVAKENEAVRKAIELLSGGGAWGMAIMTTITVGVPMLAHHNLVPARIGGAFAAVAGHDHPPPVNGNGAGDVGVTMHPDGSVTGPDGVTISADDVAAGLKAFGVDPALFGATAVTVNG